MDNESITESSDWFPVVYRELRKLASVWMSREKSGQTLDATALVNEAWLRLAGSGSSEMQDRRYFFAAAAQSMRRILIDNARKKRRERHGGKQAKHVLPEDITAIESPPEDLIVLDELLTQLEARDELAGTVFKLKFFAGFSVEEAGEILGLPRASAYRNWNFARSWLRSRMES